MTAKPRLACGGIFQADPDVPPDHRGLSACKGCHLPGKAGDAHHTLPEVPADDAQRRAAGDAGGEG